MVLFQERGSEPGLGGREIWRRGFQLLMEGEGVSLFLRKEEGESSTHRGGPSSPQCTGERFYRLLPLSLEVQKVEN